MNFLSIFFLLFALAAIGIIYAVSDRRRNIIAANGYNATRTRQETLNRTLDENVAQRFLGAKEGDGGDDAGVCDATDRPIGFFLDEGSTGDKIAIGRGSHKTHFGIAAVSIAIGDILYTAADGKVTNVLTVDCFHRGVAMSAVSAGEAVAGGDSAIVEIDPIDFGKRAVYRGKITLGGGAVTEAITIAGLTADHNVLVSISDNNGNEDVELIEATPSADTLTLRFTEDPGDGAIVDIIIAPATNTADNGA